MEVRPGVGRVAVASRNITCHQLVVEDQPVGLSPTQDSPLACLTFGSPAAAMVFGIALLSITLAARSHCWGRKLFDPEVMDLIVAGEVAYLVLIKQGFTIFNCFLIISSLAMAYLLPYR